MPVCLSIFPVRVHYTIVVISIRNMESSFILISFVGWNTVQEAFFGRGDWLLNKRKRSASVLQCHLGSLTNESNGISVIAFCFPAMWKGISSDAPFIFNLSANARSNCPKTTEIFGANWSTHNTVGWLSLNTATWSPDFTSHISSITSHSNKSLSISKSDFVNIPVRLELEFISRFTHSGHAHQQYFACNGQNG